MAARVKTQKHRQKIENSTFETSSLNSTVVDGKLFDREVEDEDEDEDVDDGPVVFICGKCKMPVGDSMSWDGGEDGENQIRLKRMFWILGVTNATSIKTFKLVCDLQKTSQLIYTLHLHLDSVQIYLESLIELCIQVQL